MFTKKINPTFTETVDIPVPGQEPDPVAFDFFYRTTDQFDALVKEINAGDKPLVDAVREVVAGWSHPAVAFSAEKLNECISTFPGSVPAIWSTFRRGLFEGKRKN